MRYQMLFTVAAVTVVLGPVDSNARTDGKKVDKCHSFFEEPGDSRTSLMLDGVEDPHGKGPAAAEALQPATVRLVHAEDVFTSMKSLHETPDGSVTVKIAVRGKGHDVSLSESNRNTKAFLLSAIPPNLQECCHTVRAQKTVRMRAEGIVHLRGDETAAEDYSLTFGLSSLFPFRSRIKFFADGCEPPGTTVTRELEIKLTLEWKARRRGGGFELAGTLTGEAITRVIFDGAVVVEVPEMIMEPARSHSFEFSRENELPRGTAEFINATFLRVENDVDAFVSIRDTGRNPVVGALCECKVTKEEFKDEGFVE